MPRPVATSARERTPVEIPEPPQRGLLKRSNSTASIHSLPTPPRTRKRKRSHSRATDSDSESEGLLSDSDAEHAPAPAKKAGEPRGALLLGHKRRKMLQVDKIAAELSAQAAEDAFWGVATVETTDVFGGALFGAKGKAKVEEESDTETKVDAKSKAKAKAKADKAEGSKVRERSESPDLSPSSTPPSRLIKATTGTGLLSPPQSRRRSPRKKAAPAILPPVFEEAVVTPPPKLRASERLRQKQQAERDSPNNPFLDSPAAESVASSEPKTPVRPSRGRRVEKPTITYVFRGVRVEFENPLYDPRYPETGVAPRDPRAPSSLPLEHDDYEADEACPPQVLFPEAHAKLRRRRKAASEAPEASTSRATTKGKQPKRKTQKSEWDTTDEEDNADEDLPPLPRTPPPRDKRVPSLFAHAKAAEPRAEARAGPSQTRSKKPVSVGEPMMTRSRTTPQLPEKDRSDPARRALGAHEKTRPARK